jgi:hypothetical protein
MSQHGFEKYILQQNYASNLNLENEAEIRKR